MQQDLEALLAKNPDIELNNEKFRDAVFETHPDAYMRAGFADLHFSDWLEILNTPDKTTWLKLDTDKQVIEILWKVNEKTTVQMKVNNLNLYNECRKQGVGAAQYVTCGSLGMYGHYSV